MESTKMKKSNWHGGKGSGRRSSQDDKKYSDNWDKIFGKPKIDANVEYPQRTNINNRNK